LFQNLFNFKKRSILYVPSWSLSIGCWHKRSVTHGDLIAVFDFERKKTYCPDQLKQ